MSDPDLRSLGRTVEGAARPPPFADLSRRGRRRRRRRRTAIGVGLAGAAGLLAYAVGSGTGVLDSAPPEPAGPTPQQVVVTADASGPDRVPAGIDMTEAEVTASAEAVTAAAVIPEFRPQQLAWADLRIEVADRDRLYIAGIDQARDGSRSEPTLHWTTPMKETSSELNCPELDIDVESAAVRFTVPTSCMPRATGRLRFQVGLVSYDGGTDDYQEASDRTRWVDVP